MVWAQVAMAAIGLAKGGSAPPAVSSSNGNFANQIMQNGQAPWQLSMGGKGPPQAMAFRPDSFVAGLTGIDTSTHSAVGNGTAVNQPAAITNSILHNPWMWAAGAIAVVGVAWMRKK